MPDSAILALARLPCIFVQNVLRREQYLYCNLSLSRKAINIRKLNAPPVKMSISWTTISIMIFESRYSDF
ncbi:hypothetical protein ACQNH5_004368, partial [Shigella flexneri]